jgi:hypothetical protein
MADGMSYFNPRFDPPLSIHNPTQVSGFSIKPNGLGWTSQYPFLESGGREPYVYTYNIFDPLDVHKRLKQAQADWQRNPTRTGFLPEEFMPDNFFMRIYTLISFQHFC